MSNQRTGKIARLPFDGRTEVNGMIRDNIPYMQIIACLAAKGHDGINEQNLTNWKDGGHQDWLKEQARLERYQFRAENSLAVAKLASETGASIHEANLMVAATQISEMLEDVDMEVLKEKTKSDPDLYLQLLTVQSRMAKPALDGQKHRDANARALKLLSDAKKSEGSGGLSADTIERIEKELKLL